MTEFGDLFAASRLDGAAIALVRDGSTTIETFGTRREVANEAIDAQTVFDVASLSKPVFALLVMRLRAQGVLDLDDPLDNAPAVTVRMALCHTTGWPNWRGPSGALDLGRQPGTAFGYSGEGYYALQRTVERRTDERLEPLARAEVFGPLGMDASSFGEHPISASSLRTTVADYVRFVGYLLAHQDDEDLVEMWTPHVTIDDELSWGLGWGVQSAPHAVWHWGLDPTTSAFVLARPRARDACIVLTECPEHGRAFYKAVVQRAIPGDHASLRVEHNAAWIAANSLEGA